MHNFKLLSGKKPISIFIKLAIVVLSLMTFSGIGTIIYGQVEKQNYDGCYPYKLNLLRLCPKDVRKAVVIGGSSTNFGFHADLFEQTTGIRTFNMGFSAGVSFDSYLKSIVEYLNDDDVLIMLPEADYYNRSIHSYSMETSNFNLYCDNDSFVFEFGDTWQIVTNTISQGWTGWWNSILFSAKKFVANLGLHELSVYDFYQCNDNGDLLNHKYRERIDFSADFYQNTFNPKAFVNEINQYFEKQIPNITIEAFFAPTPIIHDSFTLNQNNYSKLHDFINANSDIKMLCNFSDVVFERSDFFDTQYHLTYDSGIEYTGIIAQYFLDSR